MAARDMYHQAVRTGLQKEQWLITNDPLLLQVGGLDMQIDLGAEKLLAAEKDHQQIAVEIKSFLGSSPIYDFHLAVGQYLNYRLALVSQAPQRRLYLAVPLETYVTFFAIPFTQQAVEEHQLALLIYDWEQEEIVQWIN